MSVDPDLNPLPTITLERYGLTAPVVYRNPSVAQCYEEAIKLEIDHMSRNKKPRVAISSTGALASLSGHATGRTPTAKRIVEEPATSKNVFWGMSACIPLPVQSWKINKERCLDYMNTLRHLFVLDGFAGWDPENRLKVRVICARPYHCLFMRNMLIRPTRAELMDFEPDVVIYNGGRFPAAKNVDGVKMKASVDFHLSKKEIVILGTEYAGEMKKGIFTIMHYLMPLKGNLSAHASANTAQDGGNATLFFGLSGTGKTTLSADEHRMLIGDDEIVWTQSGMFNIEGGCYAKVIDLKRDEEPLIYSAIKFGSVLENVKMDASHNVQFGDSSITQNTRVAYPIEYIPNATIPCLSGHPKNIIFLTCDSFGVLPPVSKLSTPQSMYHFINGYTAKVAGTEMGVKKPSATFSACFGEAFLVWHPSVYAQLLASQMMKHGATCWLVNTGWSGGGYGVGQRMRIKITRAIVDAIHSGELHDAPLETLPIFNLRIPTKVSGVPADILNPRTTWRSKKAYDEQLTTLAHMYIKNNLKYADGNSDEINSAGPIVPAAL